MDKLQCSHYLECYLTSPKMDTVYFLKLADENGPTQLYDVVDKQFTIQGMWGPAPPVDDFDGFDL